MFLEDPRCSLDELPRYSPWPARLLAAESTGSRVRTEADTFRQWEDEIFAPLASELRASGMPATLELILANDAKSGADQISYVGGEFVRTKLQQAFFASQKIFADFVAQFLPCENVVELGAGNGRRSILLARDSRFVKVRFLASEYTPGGRDLISLIAAAEGVKIETSACDFTAAVPVDVSIPEGAIIFTSFAVHYVARLELKFFEWLASQRPSIVIHFEPFYEHADTDSLFGLLRRRYIEVNDYNQNALSFLRSLQEKGVLEIVQEQREVFGSNAMLVGSLVAWRPVIK
jgi:hypothetical protein